MFEAIFQIDAIHLKRNIPDHISKATEFLNAIEPNFLKINYLDGNNILIIAIKDMDPGIQNYRPMMELIKNIIKKNKTIINQPGNDATTALIEAIKSQDLPPGDIKEIAELLIDNGANINAKDVLNKTALDYAKEQKIMLLSICFKKANLQKWKLIQSWL